MRGLGKSKFFQNFLRFSSSVLVEFCFNWDNTNPIGQLTIPDYFRAIIFQFILFDPFYDFLNVTKSTDILSELVLTDRCTLKCSKRDFY